MSITLMQEAAEALDGALYKLDFEYLGNTEEGRVDWWTRRGSEPHQVIRLSVERQELGFVVVRAAWPTLDSTGGVLRSSLSWTIPATRRRDEVIDSVSAVVERILEIFLDILKGTGVAAPRTAGVGA